MAAESHPDKPARRDPLNLREVRRGGSLAQAPPSAVDAVAPVASAHGEGLPVPRSGLARLFPALEHAGFRWFWLGMLPAPFAWQMYLVAAGYIAFTLSGAATTLGLVSVSVGGPMLVFALVGGVVADRLPRVTVILVTQTILGLTSAVLAVLSISGQLQVWHLIAAGLVQGTCFAFNVPARQAMVGQLVPAHLLRSAVTLNNLGMNFSRIAGPALAGLMPACSSA
jgi:MFS family permease